MTESDPTPLNYQNPMGIGRPRLPAEVSWRRFRYGILVGLLSSAAAFSGFMAFSFAFYFLWVPVAKLLAALVLGFIPEWRSFGGGLAFSALLVLLIFLGLCVAFSR